MNRPSGPDFGRTATGKTPKPALRPAEGRPEGRCRCFPGSSPAKSRPDKSISGPETILRNIAYKVKTPGEPASVSRYALHGSTDGIHNHTRTGGQRRWSWTCLVFHVVGTCCFGAEQQQSLVVIFTDGESRHVTWFRSCSKLQHKANSHQICR